MDIRIRNKRTGKMFTIPEFIESLILESEGPGSAGDFWAMSCCINGGLTIFLGLDGWPYLADRCGGLIPFPTIYDITSISYNNSFNNSLVSSEQALKEFDTKMSMLMSAGWRQIGKSQSVSDLAESIKASLQLDRDHSDKIKAELEAKGLSISPLHTKSPRA